MNLYLNNALHGMLTIGGHEQAIEKSAGTINQNSSVDLLEYVAKLLLYDDIIKHITTVSFGPVIHDDELFSRVLKDVLPDFESCISSSGKDNVGNLKTVLKIVDQHLSQSTSILKLHRSDEKRLCFEAAFLLLYSNKEEADDAKIRTIPAFLQKYPEFKDDAMIEPTEQETLMKFRNMMKLAQSFIPAKNHKEHLMDLVTRLVEGRDQKYVTGSGEKPATRRRVLIYEREGEIRPIPRPPRTNSSAALHVATEDSALIDSQIVGRKRKENEPHESRPEAALTLNDCRDDAAQLNSRHLSMLPPLTASATSVTSIPRALRLHIHAPTKMKPLSQQLSQPTSLITLKNPSPANHTWPDIYQSQTPQREMLSSLLDQHNDHKFIKDNLGTIDR